jgi:arylsulfatase A-like enzyme
MLLCRIGIGGSEVRYYLLDRGRQMNMRLLWKLLGLTAALLIAGLFENPLLAGKSDPPRRPNILWITLEDTSFFMGCYGDKVAKTPNIDRLAKEGTRFTNAFASSPVCSPARSAMITGMYVGQLGVGNHRSVVDIPDSVKGYPTYLREAGYYCSNHTKNDFNFTDSWYWARETWDDTSDQASWRNRETGQPFFSVYNFVDSHQSRTSVNSYARFKELYQSQLLPEQITDPNDVILPPFYHDSPRMRIAFARMYDCLTLVDQQVGQLLKELEADGLSEDTIVFLFADHGQGMPRFKTTPLALGFKVPLIIRVPKKFREIVDLEPGTACDKIISFVDLGPTVLNIAGLKVPEYMAGVPVLGPNAVDKSFFYGSMNDHGAAEDHCRSISDGRYFYTRNYMPHLSYVQPQIYNDGAEILKFMRQDAKAGILTGAAAEYMAKTRPVEVLYDLRSDPWEVHNLADDPQYRKTLDQFRAWNRQKILEIRDIHFLHAWEIETRGKHKTACEIRNDPSVYPLEKILEAAEMTGRGQAVLQQQFAALKDPEPMVRYWAVIGLQSQNWRSKTIQDELVKLLDDSAPYVRYEAAILCYKHSKHQKAKNVLVAGTRETHSILVNTATRKVRQLNEDAVDFTDAISQLKKRYQGLKDKKKIYEIGASITSIENLLAGQYDEPVDAF